MELVDGLMEFGLTRQEACIYIELVKNGSLTGYEVSKNTGISRSNTYMALAGLVDKGAAYITESTATRYVAVDTLEFCNNKIEHLKRLSTEVMISMPLKQYKSEGYITIEGRRHIEDKIRNLLKDTEKRVYISLDYEFLKNYKEQLLELVRTSRKVVIITNKSIELEGTIEYITDNSHNGQIRLITDSQNVLTGDIVDEYSTCLYSDKKNLVDIFKEALSNEIKLIELTKGEL